LNTGNGVSRLSPQQRGHQSLARVSLLFGRRVPSDWFHKTARAAHRVAIVIKRIASQERSWDYGSMHRNECCHEAKAATMLMRHFRSSWVDDLPDPRSIFSKQRMNVLRELTRRASGDGVRVLVYGERASILWAQRKADAAIELERLCDEVAKHTIWTFSVAFCFPGCNGIKGAKPTPRSAKRTPPFSPSERRCANCGTKCDSLEEEFNVSLY
jgi:hypothetical protein